MNAKQWFLSLPALLLLSACGSKDGGAVDRRPGTSSGRAASMRRTPGWHMNGQPGVPYFNQEKSNS